MNTAYIHTISASVSNESNLLHIRPYHELSRFLGTRPQTRVVDLMLEIFNMASKGLLPNVQRSLAVFS